MKIGVSLTVITVLLLLQVAFLELVVKETLTTNPSLAVIFFVISFIVFNSLLALVVKLSFRK